MTKKQVVGCAGSKTTVLNREQYLKISVSSAGGSSGSADSSVWLQIANVTNSILHCNLPFKLKRRQADPSDLGGSPDPRPAWSTFFDDQPFTAFLI